MVSLFSALIATVILSAPLHASSVPFHPHSALRRRINIPAAQAKAASHHQDMPKKKKRSAGKQRRCAALSASSSLLSSSTTTSSVSVAATQAQVNNAVSQPDPTTKAAAQLAAPELVVAQPATTPKPSPTPTPETSDPIGTPAAVSSSSSGGSGGLSAEQQQTFLELHNNLRAQHGAAPLTWSDTLASAGLTWATGCVFQHSAGSLGPYGENLAAGTGSSYDVTNGFDDWAAEECEFAKEFWS